MLMRPWLLVGLALCVPVLVAFLYRRRDRFATVPSTVLLSRIARSRMKNRKIRSLVRVASFLACLAAVFGLVLAAAEPRGLGDTRHIALVVDVSASMGGETEDEMRAAVRRVLHERTGRDSVVLIAAGAEPRRLAGPTSDLTALSEAVDDLEIEPGEADLVGALRLADALVAGARRPRVWLVGDGGASAVEERVTLSAPMRLLRVGGDRDNVGVTVLAARPPADALDDAEREVLVTVVASDGPPRDVRLTLSAEGTELSAQDLTVPGGGEAEATFRVRVATEAITARVAPRGDRFEDGLSTDDEARLSLARTDAPTAHLIAAEDDGAAWFVERALRASGVGEVVRHTPAGAPRRIEDGAIAVVVGAAPDHAIDGPTLFLDSGGGALPVHVAGPVDEAQAQLRSIDADHRLTRGVDLDGATIRRATAVELGPDDVGVVELDGGTVVATGGSGRERWVYLGVDPVGSDMVLRVAFPVLVANAVHALTGATDVRIADTVPRAESSLAPSALLEGAPTLNEPFGLPTAIPFLLCAVAALLLLGEGFAYLRGYAR